jgi:hypothetical protein
MLGNGAVGRIIRQRDELFHNTQQIAEVIRLAS